MRGVDHVRGVERRRSFVVSRSSRRIMSAKSFADPLAGALPSGCEPFQGRLAA
jgi:hypothetical protein